MKTDSSGRVRHHPDAGNTPLSAQPVQGMRSQLTRYNDVFLLDKLNAISGVFLGLRIIKQIIKVDKFFLYFLPGTH